MWKEDKVLACNTVRCVTLDELFNLPVTQHSHMWNGNNKLYLKDCDENWMTELRRTGLLLPAFSVAQHPWTCALSFHLYKSLEM
jgi:hypothetical protein